MYKSYIEKLENKNAVAFSGTIGLLRVVLNLIAKARLRAKLFMLTLVLFAHKKKFITKLNFTYRQSLKRPFSSCFEPHYETRAKCLLRKSVLIHMQTKLT